MNKTNVNTDRLINWFDDFGSENQFAFLSNFWVNDAGYALVWEGYQWVGETIEHIYQAMKTKQDRHERLDILTADTPGQAKALGQACELRDDWEQVKLQAMQACIEAKFAAHMPEARYLLETGNADLVEGTYWNDRVWGVDLSTPGMPGNNWLGMLLMNQRTLLRLRGIGKDIRAGATRPSKADTEVGAVPAPNSSQSAADGSLTTDPGQVAGRHDWEWE